MKRSALPPRKTPLPRSTKPLKRAYIKRAPTKRKKQIDAQLAAAKYFYFSQYFGMVGDQNFYPCQRCRLPITMTTCHAHHKLKRSLGGKHGMDNLVIICPSCHQWAHDPQHPENYKAVRDSLANAENGEKI